MAGGRLGRRLTVGGRRVVLPTPNPTSRRRKGNANKVGKLSVGHAQMASCAGGCRGAGRTLLRRHGRDRGQCTWVGGGMQGKTDGGRVVGGEVGARPRRDGWAARGEVAMAVGGGMPPGGNLQKNLVFITKLTVPAPSVCGGVPRPPAPGRHIAPRGFGTLPAYALRHTVCRGTPLASRLWARHLQRHTGCRLHVARRPPPAQDMQAVCQPTANIAKYPTPERRQTGLLAVLGVGSILSAFARGDATFCFIFSRGDGMPGCTGRCVGHTVSRAISPT